MGDLRLVIVHSHYRPGGVRRVIELALPAVASTLRPRATEIVLVGGEAPPAGWLAHVRRRAGATPVTCAIEPAVGYVSEQRLAPAAAVRRLRALLSRVLAGGAPGGAVVWAHNLGLGRNLLLAETLHAVGAERRVPVVYHHHDWWFDNRWARWPEMRRSGFGSLAAVARAILPSAGVKHAAINDADAQILGRHLGAAAGWLPNPAAPAARPGAGESRRARRWLRKMLGDDGPVWIVPCRLLRRKNLAEALLLTRWLRPEAWLVTTGAASSADEQAYAAALAQAARRHGWRLRLSVLAGDEEERKPSVEALLSASEAVLLTSLQEGFGLPNLEAAAAGRPLLARTLPNIAPDLARFGFRFPQAYAEVLIDTGLFDAGAERRRQLARWRAWRAGLPAPCRALAGRPALLVGRALPAAVPFSRLTLTAQLEVLARPADETWTRCLPRNPWLASWRARAATGTLRASAWPAAATRRLDGPAYARRFSQLLRSPAPALAATTGQAAMAEFIRAKLAGDNQYPLLWSAQP